MEQMLEAPRNQTHTLMSTTMQQRWMWGLRIKISWVLSRASYSGVNCRKHFSIAKRSNCELSDADRVFFHLVLLGLRHCKQPPFHIGLWTVSGSSWAPKPRFVSPSLSFWSFCWSFVRVLSAYPFRCLLLAMILPVSSWIPFSPFGI